MSVVNRKRNRGVVSDKIITHDFIKKCKTEFNNDETKILKRNVVVNSGSFWATIDSNEANKVSHIFLNTIKRTDTRATNQGSSGRCWMFSGLNVFRHNVINGMGLDNFEFSETYLFFWDKWERSNSFLQFFIDNEGTPEDRLYDCILTAYLEDGGWWNTFSNLVNKYGVVPKDAMPETATSDWSTDINQTVLKRLKATAAEICRSRRLGREKLIEIKKKCLQNIYDILVMYLGEPPSETNTFTWFYNKEEGFHDSKGNAIPDLTPMKFKKMTVDIKDDDGNNIISVDDFIVLANMPNYGYNKTYEVKHTDNVQGGKRVRILNVPMKILKKHVLNQVIRGIPVWFAGDVNKGFNPINAALNEKLVNEDLLFGKVETTFTKGDQMKWTALAGNHAMTLTGVNVDDNGDPTEWQVENSWGYYDSSTPGLDGWLTMSDSWFENCLQQVAVHKAFLPEKLVELYNSPAKLMEPYDSLAPALRVSGMARPHNWLGMDKRGPPKN